MKKVWGYGVLLLTLAGCQSQEAEKSVYHNGGTSDEFLIRASGSYGGIADDS
ncbi:hypothetical protein [Halobacillus sp. A5]|uniref:hypothetical protein n=1 Tax=Halobacillus sp. A5 TaxID=2880263 RepID=UPI0020A640D5|nr:hypothetical protein [Halobacillus sp. A5]MCP3027107.1 hypothetical protein [Halobacillus sp. A5]